MMQRAPTNCLSFASTKAMLKDLLDSSHRGYVRHSYHDSDEDSLHLMGMLLNSQTSIIPHRSTAPGANYYIVITGCLRFLQWPAPDGKCIVRTMYSHSGVFKMDRLNWRAITNPGDVDCFYLECTSGPFAKTGTRWNWQPDLESQKKLS